MNKLHLTIDPCNPGQFYACCGLLELFEIAGIETLSHFDLDWHRPRVAEFVLESPTKIGIRDLAHAVKQAKYRALPSPVSGDVGDATAAISTSIFGRDYTLDWWLDEYREKTSPLKMWAGNQTSIDIVQVLTDLIPLELPDAVLNATGMTTTRFSVDPRPSWLGLALHLGYSTNERLKATDKRALSYPVVEMFAAFGLQACRPLRLGRRDYQYGMWLDDLAYPVSALVATEAWKGLKYTSFDFSIENRDNSGRYKTFTFAKWNA
jgi:CRISPR-associated protein Csx14